MSVYFDDIIFLLQRDGGISRYWKEVTDFENSRRGTRVLFGLTVTSFRSKFARLLKFIPILYVGSSVYHSSYQRPLLYKGKTKIVLTIHDCIYERFERGFRKWIHVLFTSWAIRQADKIIAVSESTAKDILKYYSCNEKKISVIHNGSDKLSAFTEVEGISFPYLLYVGNRGYCKNFSGQMQLAARFLEGHEKFRIVILGGGFLTSDERKLLDLHGIRDRVVVFQGLSDAELRFVYRKAHVLLIQSIYEGFGIPVVEAARLGCPVLCSKESSFPEIVGQEYPGMIGLSDQFEALKFLENLLDFEYRVNIKKMLIKISSKFTWENSRKLHHEIYEILC